MEGTSILSLRNLLSIKGDKIDTIINSIDRQRDIKIMKIKDNYPYSFLMHSSNTSRRA